MKELVSWRRNVLLIILFKINPRLALLGPNLMKGFYYPLIVRFLFSLAQPPFSATFLLTIFRLIKKVESINPDIDLDNFVSQNKPQQPQPPARAQYMSWDGTLIEDLGPRRDTVSISFIHKFFIFLSLFFLFSSFFVLNTCSLINHKLKWPL